MRGSYEHVLEINLLRFAPEEAKKRHINIARRVLESFIERQREKIDYEIFTDGVKASSEQSVQPFGVIRYVFLRMSPVGKYAITTARRLSPKASGRYQRSWILIADGKQVAEDDIPNSADQLILVNTQPYARKIHLRGARLLGVPPGIVEKIKQMVNRRFRTVTGRISFISLHSGYTLRRDYVQVRQSGNKRVHTKAGAELTYPALIIEKKF